jgi:radical SAM superfamily enzyme YgiQ (UPF0313 family)
VDSDTRNIPDYLLHDILPFVERPSRYIGGERGTVAKDFEKCGARIALAFPDVYEIGTGNLGHEILYHMINSHVRYIAERVYAPWDDLESELLKKSVPLYTLESKIPVREFDILAFTVSYELGYSGILTMLNSSGIPLKSHDRIFPIVGMGGECAFNPSVMRDYVDFFHLGDGESVINEIARIIADSRDDIDNHRDDPELKKSILERIAGLSGIYVPSIGKSSEHKSVLKDLDSAYYPKEPIVPYFGEMKSRITLEIFRGCTQGCRFCQAGYIYRPYRKRSVERLTEIAHASFAHTGHTEISLSSLNTTDYPDLKRLIETIVEMRGNRPLRISIPSSRISSFDSEFAEMLKPYSSGSITLAIEAGTDRLRKVINKHTTDDEITSTVESALTNGLGELKLYFMVGLPTETDDDVFAIISQVRNIRSIYGRLQQEKLIPPKTNFRMKVSVSNFVPKPHTPFQWCAMDDIETMIRKHDLLKPIRSVKSSMASFHRAEASFLEGVIARGDEKIGRVIERAWRMGSRFESWKERLDLNLWNQAFNDEGINPAGYVRERSETEVFPWDDTPSGISKPFLRKEYEKALRGEETSDCFETDCAGCGLWKDICVDLPRGK